MAKIVADRVLETSTTTGTGTYTLAGAVTGFRAASAVCANGDTFEYYAEDVDANGVPNGGWETGLGTWATGGTLARTTIYASSNANAAVSWSAGTRRIGLSLTASAISTIVYSPGSDDQLTRKMFKDCGVVYFNSGTTNALDYVNGSQQRWAPNTGAQTLSISNWPPSGNLGELLIEGVNLGAATITWPTINWVKSDGTTTTTFSSNGVTLQASGTDFVFLWTRDGGTTIYGKVVR